MATLARRLIVSFVSLLGLPAALIAADASPPATLPTTRPTLPAELGVNIHFTKPQPGEMKQLAAAGVSLVRMDFSWAGTERRPGQYDFAAYDGLVRELEPHGIRAVFILDYGNKLYDDGLAPHTPAGRAAFAKWAAAAAARFAGKRVIWEMWNEPNHKQFWKPKPSAADYAALAIETGKAVRAADPAATFIGPATSTIDLPFLEACFKAGCLEVWEAVSVHPYRQGPPETVAEEYRALRTLIAKYAPKDKVIPIYSGEWGYSSVAQNVDAETQGRYLPRQWLTNIANGVPLSVWYDWKDDGKDPKEHEHHFGTVGPDRRPGNDDEPFEPKPAYRAMRTLTEQLAGYRYCNRPAVGDHGTDYVLLFATHDSAGTPVDVKLAVWTTAAGPRELTIPCSPGGFTRVTSRDAPPEKLTAGPDGLRVTATGAVQYFAADRPAGGRTNESLLLAAAWRAAPLDQLTTGGARTCVPSAFRNPTAATIRVYTESAEGSETYWADFEPGKLLTLPVRVQGNRQPVPVVRRMTLVVDGRPRATQWATLLSQSILSLDVLDVVDGRATVRVAVTNRGLPDFEDWFGGFVRAEREGTPAPPPPPTRPSTAPASTRPAGSDPLPPPLNRGLRLDLSADRPSAVVPIPLPDGTRLPDGTYRFALRAAFGPRLNYNSRFVDAATYAPVRLSAGDAPAFRAAADGDKNVKSEQSVRLAAPASGPLAEGIASVELTYRFDAGHKFVQLVPTTDDARKLPGEPKELRVWVRGDGSGNLLRARVVGADGQTFQPDAGRITWTDWRLVTFKLDGSAGGHWGGKNDGVVRYPLRLDTLVLIDNAERAATGGTVYVASPMAVE